MPRRVEFDAGSDKLTDLIAHWAEQEEGIAKVVSSSDPTLVVLKLQKTNTVSLEHTGSAGYDFKVEALRVYLK
jgi:hypothetical protein